MIEKLHLVMFCIWDIIEVKPVRTLTTTPRLQNINATKFFDSFNHLRWYTSDWFFHPKKENILRVQIKDILEDKMKWLVKGLNRLVNTPQ